MLQGQTAGNGIFGMGSVLAVLLGNGGHLPQSLCKGIYIVKQILAGSVQIDFMGGYQGSQGKGDHP